MIQRLIYILMLTTVVIAFAPGKTNAAIGYTEGIADVSVSGEATYSIPIFAPPSSNGLTPSLTLSYGHRSAEGLAGIGWNVSGLSQITRCAKSLVQNGAIDGVNLESDDAYCLDGNQLRRTTGTHGASGSTYRTEIDLMSRITANGVAGNGPAWFLVEAKDGLIYEYGNTSDSRIESLAPNNTTTARSWTLSKIRDRSGNEIRFTYIEDGAPFGSYRINRVEYRVNGLAGLPTPGYKIEFIYENQPAADVNIQYGAGGLVEDIKRLDRVDVWYTVPITDTLVRRYEVTYEASLSSAGRSRVQSVQECAGTPLDCLSATTFTYQDGTNDLDSTVSSGAIIPSGTSPIPLDINGDGRTDLAYPSATLGGKWIFQFANDSGGYGPVQNSNIDSTNNKKAIAIDYNSDGNEDLLVPYNGTTWWAILGGTSGFQFPIDTGAPAESGNKDALALDMNGDGRHDLVYRFGSLWVRYRLASGGFSATPTQLAYGARGQGIKRLNTFNMERTTRFDANGDGLEDIAIFRSVVRVGHYIHVLLGGGGDFFISNVNGNSGGFPIDVNGDGYTDVAYYHSTTGGFWYMISSGEALGPQVSIGTFTDFDLPNALPMDWDNDGFMDILVPNITTGTLYLIRSKGHSFDAAVNTNIPSSTFSNVFRTDSNGDSMDDIAFVDTSGNYSHKTHAGIFPDLLDTVTDGNGNTIAFEYSSLADPSVYTKYATAVFPEQDYVGTTIVVSKIVRSNGLGGTYENTYQYAGMQLNLVGRGLSGFDKRIVYDGRDGNVYTERYRRNFPYRGRPYQTDTNIGDIGQTLVQQITYDWQQLSGGSGTETYFYPYIAESVERNYEGEGIYNGQQIDEITTTTLVDSFGTPYDVTTVSEENASGNGAQVGASYTERTYYSSIVNSTSPWCLGKAGQVERINSHNQTYGAQITRTTSFVWDTGSSCRLTQSIVEPGSVYQVTSSFGYDAFGNVNSTTTTPIGMPSRSESTNWGIFGQYPTVETNKLGQISTSNWDYAVGRVISSFDPNAIYTSSTYDEFGRMKVQTKPDQTRVEYVRSSCDVGNNFCGIGLSLVRSKLTLSAQQVNGIEIRQDEIYLDSMNRKIQIGSQSLTGVMSYERTIYDGQGRIIQESAPDLAVDPSHYTVVEYDKQGRPSKYTRPIDDSVSAPSQSTTVFYEGLTKRVVDAEGNESAKVRDVLGRMFRSIDDAGYYQQFEYDAFGSVRRVSNSDLVTLSETTYDYGISAFRRIVIDLNLGSWAYSPNALGEETSYTDAKLQTISWTYDKMGRPLTRVEPEGTTTWTWGSSSANHNIGRLQSVSGPGHSQTYDYDSYGRLVTHSTTSDTLYEIDYAYDSSTGLLSSIEYPESTDSFRLKLLREYQYGILKKVKRSDGIQEVYWEANDEDAFGNVINTSLGNGVQTTREYDGVSGYLQFHQAGVGSGTAIQNMSYEWDKVGNLKKRSDLNKTLDEEFFYDARSRLDYSKLNGIQNLNMTYNNMGNIIIKDDVSASNWSYHPAKKGAVTTAGANSYTYDANGNMSTRNGDNIEWASFNYPSEIVEGSKTYTFAYDANRKKWMYGYDNGNESETTYYVGGIFEKNVHSGDTEYRHYIHARGQSVAIHIRRQIGSDYNRYILRDHQGSISSLLNSSGGKEVDQSFAAFGERRDSSDWVGSPTPADLTIIANTTDRGYTDHNHLQDSSLIHMNGRVLDARIGRFLSPDPYVTDPGNTQNWNRYNYVYNNPMTLTDPTGHCEIICASIIGSIFGSFLNHASGGGSSQTNLCFVAGPTPCSGSAVSKKLIHFDLFRLPGTTASWDQLVMNIHPVVGAVQGIEDRRKQIGAAIKIARNIAVLGEWILNAPPEFIAFVFDVPIENVERTKISLLSTLLFIQNQMIIISTTGVADNFSNSGATVGQSTESVGGAILDDGIERLPSNSRLMGLKRVGDSVGKAAGSTGILSFVTTLNRVFDIDMSGEHSISCGAHWGKDLCGLD